MDAVTNNNDRMKLLLAGNGQKTGHALIGAGGKGMTEEEGGAWHTGMVGQLAGNFFPRLFDY
jgi:hypothetical protein